MNTVIPDIRGMRDTFLYTSIEHYMSQYLHAVCLRSLASLDQTRPVGTMLQVLNTHVKKFTDLVKANVLRPTTDEPYTISRVAI